VPDSLEVVFCSILSLHRQRCNNRSVGKDVFVLPFLKKRKAYGKKERRIVMSSIMKPPSPGYSAPPYPNYAPFPGYTQPPRRSYRWVWITLGILLLVCVVGVALVVGFAVSSVGGPTIASDQYYTAIRDQDYARAYSYLGSNVRAMLSQEAFTQAAQQQDAAFGRVSKYAYTNVPVGDPATANLTVTRANGTSYTVHLELRQEGGVWKITAFDRI
jgi:hypothetical protein